MSFDAKKKLTAALIAIFLAWPVVHLAAAHVFEINPWKFAGFGMYAVPVPEYTMAVTGYTSDNRSFTAWPGEVREAGDAFLKRRKNYGRLANPRAMANAAFDAVPAVDRIEIVITHAYLDPKTSRIASESRTYTYKRGQI